MKILQLSQYYQPHIGGVEKHLSRVNAELIKHGHQVKVLSGNDRPQLAKTEIIDQVETIRLDNRHSTFYKLKIWSQILANLKLFFWADIVQIHDVFWWILPIYPLIFKKVFITFHGYEGHDLPNQKAIFWHRLAHKFSRGSLAIGDFHQKYYGVSANQISFGASDKGQKNKQKKTNKIIFVGRLAQDNGILTYLAALATLQKQKITYQLDVYGDGPLKKQAKTFAQDNQLQVKFHGFVPNAEQLFSNYSLAFVSRYLSIIEALKNDCQVISYAHNQQGKDYLELSPFRGLIHISHSAQQIAQILKNKTKKEAINPQLAKKLSWPHLTQQYLTLWQKK